MKAILKKSKKDYCIHTSHWYNICENNNHNYPLKISIDYNKQINKITEVMYFAKDHSCSLKA